MTAERERAIREMAAAVGRNRGDDPASWLGVASIMYDARAETAERELERAVALLRRVQANPLTPSFALANDIDDFCKEQDGEVVRDDR